MKKTKFCVQKHKKDTIFQIEGGGGEMPPPEFDVPAPDRLPTGLKSGHSYMYMHALTCPVKEH